MDKKTDRIAKSKGENETKHTDTHLNIVKDFVKGLTPKVLQNIPRESNGSQSKEESEQKNVSNYSINDDSKHTPTTSPKHQKKKKKKHRRSSPNAIDVSVECVKP